MIRKAAGFYSIIIGISVLGMWSATLLTGGISEGPIEIAFHLASEFLMAILLLISGIALLRGKRYGEKIFLVSNGLLIYSVLNAAGYFWQRNDFIMPCFFMLLFIISTIFIIRVVQKPLDK